MPFDLSGKPPVKNSAELQRVLALPRRAVPAERDLVPIADRVVQMLGRPPGPCRCAEMGRQCIRRPRPVQAWTLYELEHVGGILGFIAVGAGKSFLDLLAPLVVRDCRVALLLVPPTLVDQIVFDYHLVGQHFRVPTLVVHRSSRSRERSSYSSPDPGVPVLHVLPYSRLSLPESTTWLEGLKPDLIIADEADKLCEVDGAGAGRVARYQANHPATRFCFWSGSLTDKSLLDWGHLATWALRAGSPLPWQNAQVLEEWASAYDAVPYPRPPGALMALCRPGESPREGLRRRIQETWGVVHSEEAPVSAAIVVREKTAPPVPPEVRDALKELREKMVRPDGEELLDALTVAKSARELACGFFYYWYYPAVRGVPQQRATIEAWFAARKAWMKELRVRLARREEHLDSEFLCTKAAMRYHGQDTSPGPAWASVHWPRWSEVKDTVVHETRAQRLHPYLVEDAAAWAHANRGIVWYDTREFGAWLAEVSGLPLHGGGAGAGARILAERGRSSIIASIASHGRGRDGLQFHFADQLVVEPPSSSKRWEQLLGRLHRPGTKATTITALWYAHVPELRAAMDQALERARYVSETIGAGQKILAGMK
ncbi:MAG TPA: hypothetical protein VFQ22_10545 [Longimicrobiales bacterium]|nr:hypothetical protein [Longimicrobiales bacterium]